MMPILGISRSPRFSPNSIARDEAIFSAVTSHLQAMGHDVITICEDDITETTLHGFSFIFSMGRDKGILRMLADMEIRHAVLIVNSPTSLLQSSRAEVTRRLLSVGIPLPETNILHLTEARPCISNIPCPLWLKRIDACAQSKQDVRFVPAEEALPETLQEFIQSGITTVQVEAHVTGDLIKFYGVEGSDFFYYCYPTDHHGFTKFGLEAHNGFPQHYPFRVEDLKAKANQAAESLNWVAYGGDAVIGHDGSFTIIDFNDWPSFFDCKEAAAAAIATRLVQLYAQREKAHIA